MAKRLVVCCDGTWNRPDQAGGPTNVAKLALGVAREDGAGVAQPVYYHRGVGTDRAERIRGGAFGFGLSRHVRDCYRFVIEHFEPGDELFVFGFSRGAFTARSTVGLVRNAGVLRPEHADRVDEAYRLYRSRTDERRPSGIESRIFRRMYSYDDDAIDLTCVGVWDTVGALGIPGWRAPFTNRLWGFHDTSLSSRVRFAFQALAIDELRGPFQPTLWEPQAGAVGQRLEQVWFSGAHSDIGGGYLESALAEIALSWMARRAGEAGLALSPDHFQVVPEPVDGEERKLGRLIAPDALGPLHPSRKGLYRLLRPLPRVLVDAKAPSAVASTAVLRLHRDPGYRPGNLVAYVDGGGAIVELPWAGSA